MSVQRVASVLGLIPITTRGLAYAATPRAQGPVTFSEHVAPIVFANCTPCHRPGEAAPFSLLSYRDARPLAKAIASATASHVMPPWKAGPSDYRVCQRPAAERRSDRHDPEVGRRRRARRRPGASASASAVH